MSWLSEIPHDLSFNDFNQHANQLCFLHRKMHYSLLAKYYSNNCNSLKVRTVLMTFSNRCYIRCLQSRPVARGAHCAPPPFTISKFLPVLVFYFAMWAVLCLPSSSMQMISMLSQILTPLYAHWATAAEWNTETSDNLQCLHRLKKILVKLIKICKFLSDSNKEAKCARLWIFQYSANYLLTWVMGP